MVDDVEYERLLEAARKLPPMTPEERAEQALDFVYGQLAASNHHKPLRAVFKVFALDAGWTEERFERWADERTGWHKPEGA